MVFGAVLGWEREAQHKPAGLRTHILVALGSALFILLGLQLHHDLIAKNQAGNADIMKVLEGVIGGIGFLGAGSIIQSRRGVSGLTTAATIWLTAAVGVAAGLGYYRLSAIATVLALVVLLALGFLTQGKDYLSEKNSSEASGTTKEREIPDKHA